MSDKMFHTADYERFVSDYVSNCGDDPGEYLVSAVAEILADDLQGGTPDAMDSAEFAELVLEWRGKVEGRVRIVDFQAAAMIMDPEIRERLCEKLAPCTQQEFYDAYCEEHEKKFGEEFAPESGAAW